VFETNSDAGLLIRRAEAPPGPAVRWHPVDIVAALALLGTLQAVQLFIVRSGMARGIAPGPAVPLLLYFPTILTVAAVYVLAVRRGMRLRSLGFVRPRSWRPAFRAFAAALVAGPAYGLMLLSLEAASAPLTSTLTSTLTSNVVLGALTPGFPVAAVAVWAVPIVTTVPLLEEVIFRGLLFRGLRARFALVPALIVTGLLFAAFHMDLARLIPLAIAGAAFAYAYERSGSIWPAIAAHAGLNGVWVAVVLLRPLVHS
jgi:membrane protease YdiL (CAAX protease family)